MGRIAGSQLAEAAQRGDGEAFAELFRRHRGDVERLARQLLGRAEGCDDVTSEAFLRARSALDDYDPARPFRPWLLTIAARLAIDRLRRRGLEARLVDARDLDESRLAAPGPSPLVGLLRAEERAALRSALEALPEQYRAPLALRYFAELDYARIGELLGVKSDQVGSLLLRSRRRLRRVFERRQRSEAER